MNTDDILDFAVRMLYQGDNGDTNHVNMLAARAIEAMRLGDVVEQADLDALVRGECCTPELSDLEDRLDALGAEITPIGNEIFPGLHE